MFNDEHVTNIVQTLLFYYAQEDKNIWSLENNGIYYVKSAYKILTKELVDNDQIWMLKSWLIVLCCFYLKEKKIQNNWISLVVENPLMLKPHGGLPKKVT